jgi:hypothetical protein
VPQQSASTKAGPKERAVLTASAEAASAAAATISAEIPGSSSF